MRERRFRRSAPPQWRFVVLSVVAFTLGTAPPAAAGAARSEGCNPLGTATCMAPFPSDVWTVTDASSPTGVRVAVPDSGFRPALLSQLPAADGIMPSTVFAGSTGFSAGTAATFEFPERPAPPPADGGDLVVAYDLTTKQRVPITTVLSAHARDPLIVSRKSHVVQVFAQKRWEFGHRVLVTVAGALQGGGPMLLDRAAAVKPTTRAARYTAEVLAAIASVGADASTTRTATMFTVRDRASVLAPTERLMADTMSRPHPTRNVRTRWTPLVPYAAALVTGEVRLDNYRTRDGIGPVDPSGETRSDQWVPFRLTLPASAGSRPAPVVMYAHGVSLDKEADVLVSITNAQLGLATLAIDWPNHGSRSRVDGGYVLDILKPKYLGVLSGLFQQATPDLAGVYTAIATLHVDALQPRSFTNPLGRGSDGRNDIKPSSISLMGTSLGGCLGANFGALAPKLDAISFQVSGSGLGRVIAESILWIPFSQMLPKGRTGTEDAILQGMVQHALDPADSVNTLDFVRYPRPGQNRKPLQIVIGVNDLVVPNTNSAVAANLLDLPIVGRRYKGLPGVRHADTADPDGYELRQFRPPLWTGGFRVAVTHTVGIQPETMAAQSRFMRQFGPRP